jgi:hypothetical protein
MNFYAINDAMRTGFKDEKFLFYFTWYYLFVILIEAGVLTLSGYKKFGWAFLFSFIANTFSSAFLIFYTYSAYFKPFNLAYAFLLWFIAAVLIEFGVLLVFMNKTKFINVVVGVLMANLISSIISVIIAIAKIFYLS